MTGPNLVTRVGAAIAKRRPAAVPPDAPAAPGPATTGQGTTPAEAATPAQGTTPARGTTPGQDTVPAPLPAAAQAGPGRSWPAWVLAVLRRHWLFAVLLAAGLVLRVLAAAAYRPALIYVDTLKYLYGASPGSEPLGYRWLLKIILVGGDLGTVAAIQHLLGLAMAMTLYAVLLRRGLPRWLAALTAAPVLLDAYELQMEQMIMPDVWFEALVVAGLALLLWRPVVTVRLAAVAGLILAASATVMQLGVVLVVPAVVFLLAAGGGWRRALTTSTALALAFLLVILGYCSVSYVRDGHFSLARRQTLTGRLAVSADCATLKLSADARAVCPTRAQQALGPDWLEHSGKSPLFSAPLPPGATHGAAIADLKTAVLSQQPWTVAASIIGDSARLFALTREPVRSITPIGRWQFQVGYPTYPPWVNVCPAGSFSPGTCMIGQQAVQRRVAPVTDLLVRADGPIVVGVQRKVFGPFHASVLNPAYGGPAQVNRPLAAFLRSYQLHGGYTPGPLLALFGVTALAGSLLLASRRIGARTRQLALACLLFTGTAVFTLLAPDVYQFSWRYELPVVITLVPAGVLGITALLRLRGAGRRPGGGPDAGAGEAPAGPQPPGTSTASGREASALP